MGWVGDQQGSELIGGVARAAAFDLGLRKSQPRGVDFGAGQSSCLGELGEREFG